MNALAGRTAEALCLEACALGTEALRICFKSHGLALDDPRRWPLSQRMFAISHRLKQISEEISHENRTLQKHTV